MLKIIIDDVPIELDLPMSSDLRKDLEQIKKDNALLDELKEQCDENRITISILDFYYKYGH